MHIGGNAFAVVNGLDVVLNFVCADVLVVGLKHICGDVLNVGLACAIARNALAIRSIFVSCNFLNVGVSRAILRGDVLCVFCQRCG